MNDLTHEEWTKSVSEARERLRERFPDMRCLRCGKDDFLLRLWPDAALSPGFGDNKVIELICESCGFQEKHVLERLTPQ